MKRERARVPTILYALNVDFTCAHFWNYTSEDVIRYKRQEVPVRE
jgi:hypothetical protein